MLEKLKTWKEAIKMRESTGIVKPVNNWIRDNVIRVLREEGWKDYFAIPRSIDELMDHFSYTDENFLLEIMDALENDKSIERLKSGHYQLTDSLSLREDKVPAVFDDSIVEILKEYADFIPDRLKGEYIGFSGSFNLFNWDDWLANFVYEQIRKAAFAFTPETLKNPGVLLDGGCGMGWSTSAIWLYYYKKGHFHPQTPLKIHGIDVNEDFIKIAKEEFDRIASRHDVLSREEIKKYREYYPEFKVGSVSQIPHEDESFDYVYMSQVLPWTDAKATINEVARVLRPGGIFFGANVMIPNINPFISIHMKVIEGATGAFRKEDMTRWLKEAGFSKIRYTTPIKVFRCQKPV